MKIQTHILLDGLTLDDLLGYIEACEIPKDACVSVDDDDSHGITFAWSHDQLPSVKAVQTNSSKAP